MSAVSHAQDIKIMSILGKNMVRCELGGLYSVIALRVTSKSSLKGKQHMPISINKLQPLEMRGKKVLSAAAVPSKPDSWGSKKNSSFSPETLLCSCRDLGKLPCRFCTGATVHPCKFYKVLFKKPRDEQGEVSCMGRSLSVALQWDGWHSIGSKLINFFMMARSYGCCIVEQTDNWSGQSCICSAGKLM